MSPQQQKYGPTVAITLTLITTTGVLGTAFLNNWDKLFPNSVSNSDNYPIPESVTESAPDLTVVYFYVRDRDDDRPIEKVDISFIFDGAPIVQHTDSYGYAYIELPERNNIEVILRKPGFISQTININLLEEQNKKRTVLLDKVSTLDINTSKNNDDSGGTNLPENGSNVGGSRNDSHQSSISTPRTININPIPTSNSRDSSNSASEQVSPSIGGRLPNQTWSSDTGKTRLLNLGLICYGERVIESVETVFGYDKAPFYGKIEIQFPKRDGCTQGDILQGAFNLQGSNGNCIGDVSLAWENAESFYINWTITNLGTSCPVTIKEWEIRVSLIP